MKAHENGSLAESLASLPESEIAAILAEMTESEALELIYDWQFWARPSQLPPPGSWRAWLIMAGRGFGKTRAGSEWVRMRVESGRYRRIALVGETAADVRDVMIEGESGILAISRPDFRPVYQPSKRRLVWPNGAIATAYSGDAPGQLRGPQHDSAWADEAAKWKYAQEAWDNLEMGLRLGGDPRVVVTTTPRPIPLLRLLLEDQDVVVTRGSTYDNMANLPAAFMRRIIDRYEGTRLGRQELHAELLDDAPGALWKRDQLEVLRVRRAPQLARIVVAVDPAATAHEDSSETGIVVAGLGEDNHGYVLDDVSLRGSPHGWASQAVAVFHKYEGDRIVAEVNQGGDMVETVIHTVDPDVPVTLVRATRGKYTRAEPVAALYEQGRVHHLGMFPELEDQLCTWEPGNASPDRLDALVWALTELMLGREGDDIVTSAAHVVTSADIFGR